MVVYIKFGKSGEMERSSVKVAKLWKVRIFDRTNGSI
jgi:hypothetical protein